MAPNGNSASGFQSSALLVWAADLAATSPIFQASIDKLRGDAARVHSVALPLETMRAYTFEELAKPGQWRRTTWRNHSLEFVARYLGRCKRVAARHLYTSAAAPLIHELARIEFGYRVRTAALGPVAPSGAFASTLAADQNGFAGHLAGATACRVQRYQYAQRLRLVGYPRDVFRFARGIDG